MLDGPGWCSDGDAMSVVFALLLWIYPNVEKWRFALRFSAGAHSVLIILLIVQVRKHHIMVSAYVRN